MKRPLICYHGGWFAEEGWLRRLLGDAVGPLEVDLGQERVEPNAVVFCVNLECLKPALLQRIRETPGVVLFHLGDEWYRSRLEVYRNFAHVIREFRHPGLVRDGISQIPLGPCRDIRRHLPAPRASERSLVWSFAGQVIATRRSMLESLSVVQPNLQHVTAGTKKVQPLLDPGAYSEMLHDSTFVPCPMGNVNLESFRLYEALDAGAIPIVERRPWMDYYTQLLGEHPLPSVTSWDEAVHLMKSLLSDPAAMNRMQMVIHEWWGRFQNDLRQRLSQSLDQCWDAMARPLADARLPGKWRGRAQMLLHHNGPACRERLSLTLQRLSQRR
jgi:hypothetical protein